MNNKFGLPSNKKKIIKPKHTSIPDNGELPQHVLNKRFIEAKTRLADDQARGVRTREKANRLMLAQARGEVIEKDLVVKQAAFLFVAMRQKMLGAGLAYHRKLLACKDAHSMLQALTE